MKLVFYWSMLWIWVIGLGCNGQQTGGATQKGKQTGGNTGRAKNSWEFVPLLEDKLKAEVKAALERVRDTPFGRDFGPRDLNAMRIVAPMNIVKEIPAAVGGLEELQCHPPAD